MRARRLDEIPGFGIDKVADAAGEDPDVLRLENLDIDIPPPPGVIEATRDAIGKDEYNSYLPFSGRTDLKEAVADHVDRRSGVRYDPASEIVITSGEADNLLDVLLATTDPGDEVVLTDPTYAGMINRVRLAGAVPRFVPHVVEGGVWRLDLDALRAIINERTRALFVMSASFPTGAVFDPAEWEALTSTAREHDLHIIYWALMEGFVFDGREILHPASFPSMRDRVITVGSVSLEYRMIGWRVGWIVADSETADAAGVVHVYNSVVAGGFGQAGAVVALQSPPDDFRAAVEELERRHDAMMQQLKGLPAVAAEGGCSLLLNTEAMGIDPQAASARLLEHNVAATPMTVWGESVAPQHVRLVFSNEPVERIELLGERLRRALT
ncbi:MAG TPA: pyridoxal phosphate-dependent aminotransferase [Actinomycetota bacterium]|nr:pyridoxal phosphate-dependent aminotransferase [Actinomycetota bacterium]